MSCGKQASDPLPIVHIGPRTFRRRATGTSSTFTRKSIAMKDQPTLFDSVTSDDRRNRQIQLDGRQRSALIAVLEVSQGTEPTPEQIEYLVSGATAILQWAVGARATKSTPAPQPLEIRSPALDAEDGHALRPSVAVEAQYQLTPDECRDSRSCQSQPPQQRPPDTCTTGRGP